MPDSDHEPLVSVVLPTYNRMAFLPAAVQSVLDQTLRDWELIVVDDGSTDDTRRYVSALQDARVRLIGLEHTGHPSRVRNAGIEQARGHYIAFLDSDDLWTPEKLELQIGALQASDSCRWSYTTAVPIDESGAPIPQLWRTQQQLHDGWILEALIRMTDAVLPMDTVIVERRLLQEAGGFDETMTHVEDYDLWQRLATRSAILAHPEPTARVRVHAGRFGRDVVAMHEGWLRVYGRTREVVTDPRLRALCTTRRMQHVLALSRTYSGRAQLPAAFRTLVHAFRDGWHRPAWWVALGRAVLRPLVPAAVVSAARRRGLRRAARPQ